MPKTLDKSKESCNKCVSLLNNPKPNLLDFDINTSHGCVAKSWTIINMLKIQKMKH